MISQEKTIRLEPETVHFPATFISSTARFSLKINNDSEQTLHYRWCKYGSPADESHALNTLDIYDASQRDEAAIATDFHSKEFTISPMHGEVWPNRFQLVVIEFTPQIANDFKEDAYLLDLSNNIRYHILFQGKGLPPDAKFNIDTINVGHIPLETVCEYEVELSNDGKVDVDYEVKQSVKSGLKFEFIPSKAIVPVGSKQTVKIKLFAVCVGQFNETFPFVVRGAVSFHPSLILYGKIVGPDFFVSTKLISYGTISYGFMYTQSFEIENKSDISFDYQVRLLQDNSFSPREFNIVPSGGTVPKFSKQAVTIEFVPISIQKYSLKLAIDILKVGKEISVIPLTATCICPVLKLQTSEIAYGHVYIGKEYKQSIVLVDESEYPAKFEFVMPDETIVSQAKISVSKPRGVITGKQELPIEIYMTPQLLGPINVSGYIRSYGSDEPPIPFTITASSTGPTIKLSTNSIKFGNITVLKHNTSKLIITNASLIPASFTIAMQSDTSVFSCEPTCGDIEPNGSMTIKVIATLDDTINFSGKLAINFVNLNAIYVDLAATGIGSPIVSSIPMEDVNYEYILNEQRSYLPFQITNHGRRAQELRWSQSKPKVDEKAQSTFSFQIIPEQTVINPHETIDFQFVAFSSVPTNFSVAVMCNATLGRNRMELFQPNVHGIVIRPLLSFSKKEMEFVHKHNAQAEEEISTQQQVPSGQLMPMQQESIVVTNLVKLPLNITVDTLAPFSLQPNKFSLGPQEKIEITVIFDASFKQDFCSETLNRKLNFSFENHPQHLYVNLRGIFVFPNLTFSPANNLNFGNLMLNTEQTKEVTITSSSEADVEWKWQLVADDVDCDICRIFDVYPTRGKLEKGKSDSVHFSFFAYGGEDGRSAKYNATAICHIIGGPDYTISLNGAAAAISYKANPVKIDFGPKLFDSTLLQQVNLSNLSDVPITFSVKIPRSTKFSHFTVSPSDGTVPVDGSVNLNLNIVCGLPVEYNECFVIQIGHFEEIKIPIHVVGRFYQFTLSIPRYPQDLALNAASSPNDDLAEVERKLMIDRLSDKLLSLTGPAGIRRRRNQQDDNFQGFILSQYLLNTGPITIGETRYFDFELTSVTDFPISYDLKTNVLKGTGISVDPPSGSNIPAGAKVPIRIIFDTEQRTTTNIGNLEYDIRFQLTEELGFSIRLKMKLILPTLGFSKNHFDFGNVIVGQSKTMILQLQNMNTVACEFSFGEPQPLQTNTRQLMIKKDDKNGEASPPVFFTDPQNKTLPPASFKNIKITFVPPVGVSYSMQLPINIKHNTQPRYVTLSGTGVQLRIEFDPPNLNVPAVQPFSEPSHIEVQMINPTNYNIEVFSYHYDFNLFCQHFLKKEETPEDSNVTFTQNNTTASKFCICVIVHGPHMSGCSIAAKSLSDQLNLPVISLGEIWHDLIENGAAAADYTAAFFARISQPDCADGFIVDSLYALKETHETDQFILSSLKSKTCYDDAMKNPFNPVAHNATTATENALAYILAALDGHYIFFIGLKTNFDLVNERIEKIKNSEKRKKREEEQQEKNSLFNMTEDEYNNLTEEQRNEVDSKRKIFRKRLVRTACEGAAPSERGHHSHRSQSRDDGRRGREEGRSSRHRKQKDDDKKDNKDKKENKDNAGKDANKENAAKEAGKEAAASNKRKRAQVPSDPNEYSIILFNLVVGCLCNKIKDSCDNFHTIDPQSINQKNTNPEEEEEEEKDDKSQLKIQSLNSLILKEECTTEDLKLLPYKFVPSIQRLKEASFTDLIPSETITVNKDLPVPLSRFEDAPPFFSIEVDGIERELPDFDEDDLNAKKNTRGRGRGGGRGGRGGSRGGGKNNKKKNTLHINFNTNKLTGRWNLEPNSRQTIVVIFDPIVIGSYRNDLLFGISNCKCDLIKLPCIGVCDHPNISHDLKTVFDKRVARADNKTERAFANDLNEFVFGPVLVAKDKLVRNTPPLYNETIHITNTSPFPANTSFSFTDSKCPFVADPPNMIIDPESTANVKIGVHPNTIDVFRNTLTVVVEDQPEPLFINFSVESCIPTIECSITNIDFEKLLLKQERTVSLDLKNTSKLGAFWRLKNIQAVAPSIEFNQVEGALNPRGSCSVKATFSSPKPISIKKAIALEILDKQKSKVHSSIPINVTAEAFDVLFDFQYPPKLDHLQYGTLKVLQPKVLACNLKNKGKFPVNYKITFDAAIFQIAPSEGTMNPGEKPTTINFTFKANKVVTYVNQKGISLQITDPLTNTTTSVLPIPYSAETMYSSFSISPSKKLEFGPVPISASINKQLVLKNEGRFPFDFDTTGQVDDPPVVSKNPRDKKKAPPPPKPKGKKGVSHLQVGYYGISPSTGTLQPGQTITVDLDFQCPAAGEYNATLFFKVSDSNPNAGNDQVSVKLHVTNIIPEIETHDFEKIFPGTNLCIRYDVSKTNRTAFLEDEQVLHFQPLLLQQHSSVDLALVNVQPIPCTIDILIKPKGRATNTFPYDLSEKTVTLEPLATKIVQLGFNPVICDNFIGFFEGVVRGSTGDNKLFKFQVEGVGALPLLSILSGMDKGKGTSFTSNLGISLLGFTKEKVVLLSNDGLLTSHVKIQQKPNPDFEFVDAEKLEEFDLLPSQKQKLQIVFKPQKARKAELDLSISVQDNPKLVLQLSFVGEGSSEDIVFDGLNNEDGNLIFKDCVVGRQQTALFSMRNVGSSDVRFVWSTQHDLLFTPHVGHLKMGQSKQVKVAFFSDHQIKAGQVKVLCQVFKIDMTDPNAPDWDDTMKIVKFVPRSTLNPDPAPIVTPSPRPEKTSATRGRKASARRGHPAGKDLPQSPKSSTQASTNAANSANATLSTANLPTPENDPEELVRVTEVKEEPAYTLIPGKPKEMPLKANVVADFIKYQIDTSEIAFSPTMMYQTRSGECKITNNCLIRFDYSWRVVHLVCLRTNYSATHGPPFSVEPVTGYIEPGQTKSFKINFTPEEVDDFTADIYCDIPYLSQQDPPVIHVSGLSRRPLCHFNVDLSDYLSAGRRHPDYTSPLPEDIKVIELFSKGIGERTTKRLELINPTSSPYEVKWQFLGEGTTPIFCDSPCGLVSSGKKQIMIFGYLPISVKTIESLWEFQIPEHNVRVPFLFVGRIMPK